MSNKPYEVINCEYCGQMMSTSNTKENYENFQIIVNSATMLLHPNIVKKNHKEGISDSHAVSLQGYFCNPDCFIKYINKHRNRK